MKAKLFMGKILSVGLTLCMAASFGICNDRGNRNGRLYRSRRRSSGTGTAESA